MEFKSYVISYKKFLQNNIQTMSTLSSRERNSNIFPKLYG